MLSEMETWGLAHNATRIEMTVMLEKRYSPINV
jgi:hypothetical protein